MTEHGTIEYTERAFGQDADLAMNGDIMRGLVELVTNSDDAYGASDGDICVQLSNGEDGSVTVAVKDNGPGLTPEDLKRCFSVLGGRNSGFHDGGDVRGMFGRGAKDTAAFGRTEFESIKDGTYGILTLTRAGTWTLDQRSATVDDHTRLEIPEGSSGLVATIHAEVNPKSVPDFRRLSTRIAQHVQLRRITQQRRVKVVNTRPNHPRRSEIARWDPPSGEILFDGDIDIPQFETTAHLLLKKLRTPSADAFNVYASHGIEVRGSRAIYETSLFGFRGPEMKWLYGMVTCPKIDELIRSFDEFGGGTTQNPLPLIRRDRDGLAPDHPFTAALNTAVMAILQPIIDELKPSNDRSGGGDQLKQDLSQAAKQIGALLQSDLEQIDEPDNTGGDRPTSSAPIRVIPPQVSLRAGKRRTLTILVDGRTINHPETLSVSTSESTVCTVTPLAEFVPHAIYEGILIANCSIEGIGLGRAVVTVREESGRNSASSNVRVSDEPAVEPEEPTELQWANSTMSVAANKNRTITLEAPLSLAPAGSLVCRILLDGRGIELLDDQVELRQTSQGWLSGKCRIKGVEIGTTTRITASSGVNEATGSVRVSKPTGLDGLGLDFEVVNESIGDYRAMMAVTDHGHLVTIYARHSGLAQLIGKHKSDGSFEREEAPETRVAMAEIIAATIADFLTTREAQRFPEEFNDADSVLSRRNKVLNRYVIALMRMLVRPGS